MTGHDYVCFIEPLCFYKSTGLLEQAFPGLGVCVCGFCRRHASWKTVLWCQTGEGMLSPLPPP